jgi:hypothetical protein
VASNVIEQQAELFEKSVGKGFVHRDSRFFFSNIFQVTGMRRRQKRSLRCHSFVVG